MPRVSGLLRCSPSGLILLLLVACGREDGGDRSAAVDKLATGGPPPVELVETWPVETDLDSPGIPDAHRVWPDLIDHARETLDVAQFYLSDSPGGRLEPVLAALRRAAWRGVRVRLLVDAKFHGKYPLPADALDLWPNVEVRRLDLRPRGGVMHAKYFVVDGRELFVGSQNWDWRSLEHIHELGLRARDRKLAGVFSRFFARDWAAAGGEPAPRESASVASGPPPVTKDPTEERIDAAASPPDDLPPGVAWDLPGLVRLLDEATRTLDLELLSYRTRTSNGGRWTVLDDALRRAAGRGVRLRILVSSWAVRGDGGRDLAALAAVPGVAVRVLEVPESRRGPIPFARVAHAKYLVVDGRRAWLGTSNWEKSYFHASRNASLFLGDPALVAQMAAFFTRAWDSPLARPLGTPASP